MTDQYFLSRGKHATAADGRCAMEWVSYLAGEPHSDAPVCVSPVLARFCVSFNDTLPSVERQKLRPYLARTIGTRGDGLDESRTWLATDWLIRTHTPTWLALAGLDEIAGRLRALPPVLAVELDRAMVDMRMARDQAAAARAAAKDAAWTAAGVAAGVAARAAAGVAARAAARATARAAKAAAKDAAWAAAWDAARAAAWACLPGLRAWAAAGDALAPTVRDLHRSAFDLLDRMLPTEVIRLPVAPDAEIVCGMPA